MSTNEIHIRRATAQDTEAILSLMKTCFGEASNAWSEAFWTWKHQANPFGASPVLVAEAPGGAVVGVRAFMRWAWAHHTQTVPAVRAVDTAVHPDWRGQGLFTRMTMRLVEEMQEEGVAFVFNTPNAQSRPGYLKMGWELVDQFSRWIRPVRLGRCLRAAVNPPASGTWEEVDTPHFSEISALLDQDQVAPFLRQLLRYPTRYRTARSPAYLRWRYAEVPGFFYRAASAFDGAEGAVVIFRVSSTSRGLRVVAFSELLVSPTWRSRKMTRVLVRDVLRAAEADYATAIPARSSPERRVFARLGFFPLPKRGPHLTARPLNESAFPADPRARPNWHLGLGELEVF